MKKIKVLLVMVLSLAIIIGCSVQTTNEVEATGKDKFVEIRIVNMSSGFSGSYGTYVTVIINGEIQTFSIEDVKTYEELSLVHIENGWTYIKFKIDDNGYYEPLEIYEKHTESNIE